MKTQLRGDSTSIVGASGREGWFRRWRLSNVGLKLAVSWMVGIVVLSTAAPLLGLPDPAAIGTETLLPPLTALHEPLGTDVIGRSLLSRSLYGARASLLVSAGAAMLALSIGSLIGLLAGYWGRWVESTVDVVTNTMLAFPMLLLILTVVTILQPGLPSLVVGLSIIAIPQFIRVARANALAFRNREFILAARCMGASHARIIFRELLPNVLTPILSFGFVIVAILMVLEGSLSFLGFGIPAPAPSWGVMIAAGREHMRLAPHVVFVPGAFFFLTVYSLNRIGDWAGARVVSNSN